MLEHTTESSRPLRQRKWGFDTMAVTAAEKEAEAHAMCACITGLAKII